MYKLLVADDEQIVLDSIKYIVERDFKDSVLIDTSRSGREAVEKVEQLKPDIIFMDIKMPGINGIEAIKEIKNYYSNPVFVIITACEHFEFAKEAVHLGVIEYLLKPVNRYKITETVRKAIEVIESERRKRRKELDLRERLENILPVLEHGFIYSIVIPGDFTGELDSYKKILDITESGGYIITVEFGQEKNADNPGNRIGSGIALQKFYTGFRDSIKNRCRCFVGPVMLNRITVFIPCDGVGDEYVQRLDAVSIAQYISEKMREKADMGFYIGIGRRVSFECLAKSYEDSVKAVRYADSDKHIVHIGDIPFMDNLVPKYQKSREVYVVEKACIGDIDESIRVLNTIFECLIMKHKGTVRHVREGLIEIIVMLQRMAYDYGVPEEEQAEHYHYLNEFLSIDELPSLRLWCIRRIEYISQSINKAREANLSNIIIKARQFIDGNYSRDITLDEVSREVCISPHYFCKLFKEETGENFIDYLTMVRIRKAKELLEKSMMSIKEICFEVGYSDPNYFSRLFKKVVGITPTEYRERMRK